jgi:hypothetical protein
MTFRGPNSDPRPANRGRSRITATLAVAAYLFVCSTFANAAQVAIPRVDAMPNIPSPFSMTDWRAKAIAYDTFIFDWVTTGSYRPLIWNDTTHINNPRDTFGLPSYVGSYVQTSGNAHEGINCMAAVLGASLVGIDKSNQAGKNYAQMEQCYYNSASGEGLVLNNVYGDTGNTFWYDVYPGILYTGLACNYPSVPSMENLFLATADKWYTATYFMGGSTGTPNYDFTSFDFDTNTAVYNGMWKEPDAAAGIAWIEYMAYRRYNQAKYLEGADWAMQYLQGRTTNPFYENLLPFGAYAAARMNAEQGRSYDVARFINWCFEPTSVVRLDWGVATGSYAPGYEVNGLFASVSDGGGYAFAMDTFSAAMPLVPLVRYDDRFARAMGKWMLNAANNARLFYANAVPLSNQSSSFWATDSQNCVAYEGFRKQALVSNKAVADYSTPAGTIVTGSCVSTQRNEGQVEVLQEAPVAGHDELTHIWEFNVPTGSSHSVMAWARIIDAGDADNGFRFSYAASPTGPWTTMFTVTSTQTQYHGSSVTAPGSKFYIRVEDTNRTSGVALDRIEVEFMCLQCEQPSVSPYAMGDPIRAGWGSTDFGLYGSSHVGIFGGIVAQTNNPYILQLDLLKTDFYHDTAYPSYLYFNPHGSAAWVNIDVGPSPKDLYDTVSNSFLRTNATGLVNFSVPADSAVVLVLTPAGGTITMNGNKMSINGVVVDYSGSASASVADWSIY